MKVFKLIVLLILLLSTVGNGGVKDLQLNMKWIVCSPDTSSITLHHSGGAEELIEGYYYISKYGFGRKRDAAIKPGSFNLLDSDISGELVSALGQKWLENKFPIRDIEIMLPGMDVERALSLQIQPKMLESNSDSIHLFIKYAIFELTHTSNFTTEFDYNIKLYYKLVHVPFNEEVTFNYINDLFEGHTFSFIFTKKTNNDGSLRLSADNYIFDEILKSVSESNLKQTNFNFGVELFREHESITLDPDNKLANYMDHHISNFDAIIDTVTDEKFPLGVDIYRARLRFPFILYNSSKNEQYKNYNTREDLFQSTYDVIIVPISMNTDTLTADIFITYEKLNLDDNYQRWTPIKKRLAINKTYGARLEMPEENWSASFTRKGEHYDIYGYSDFERYVDEWLIIRLFNL
jgi:hypothetical protein